MCLRGLGISTHKTVSHKGPRKVGIEDKFIVQSMPPRWDNDRINLTDA